MEVNTRVMLELWTWMASLGFLAMLRPFIPREFGDRMNRIVRLWFQRLLPYMFFHIPEFENSGTNTLYLDVERYFSSLKLDGAQQLTLCKTQRSKALTFGLWRNQRTIDIFDNATVELWHHVEDRSRPTWAEGYSHQIDERRKYTLQIRKKDKERVLDKYIAHIEAKASELKLAARDLLLYTNIKRRDGYIRPNKGPWDSLPFKHPATFDTLALDGDLKSRVLADLESFAANENYYKRIGKAWKRGYLLHGPPGTGKSSMIAAIANKMRYDIYDLELTEVTSNAELRKLLLHTSNKAIIVVEDIDCSLELSGQRKKRKAVEADAATTNPARPPIEKEEQKVTLSGLLNFVDGLWSSCGQERIFLFTTNYVEKLDPALLRAGRMDMHIHLSYCTFSAFKQLAQNYLDITEHELYAKLEAAFVGTYMTPAAVSELLIVNQTNDVDVVLGNVIAALDEHRVDPATLKNPAKDDDEESAPETGHKGTKDSPLSPDLAEDKQQVIAPLQSSTGVGKADLYEPLNPKVTKTDSPREDSPLATKPLSDTDLRDQQQELPESKTKTALVTSKEAWAETQSGDRNSAVQLQAVKEKLEAIVSSIVV